jgi:thiosulfate/3-mercaptopyruvate sulfurtransferase
MTFPRTVITASQALEIFAAVERPVIIDGTLHLARPEFDGDYRASSGIANWAERHIPTSRHVDLLHEWVDHEKPYHFGAPSPDEFAVELGRAGIDGSRPVLLYDQSNSQWAARLWWTLRNAGIAAAVVDGGLAAWERAGGPIESGITDAPPPVAPPAAVDLGVWAQRAEVENIVRARHPDDPVLVCALPASLMLGRVPTRYARRGYIPESLNEPADSLLTTDGLLLGGPRPTVLAPTSGDLTRPVIVYCGGGISACLAALAIVLAGQPNVRIYDGSLEEWAADPSLPLVTA